jgi:hypothetical protein
MNNPNYATYLDTTTQLPRWRDFLAHAAAYAVFNVVFIGAWAAGGRGAFWPAFPLVGWGIGLTFQHHLNTWRGPITDQDVHDRMRASQSRTNEALTDRPPKLGTASTESARRRGSGRSGARVGSLAARTVWAGPRLRRRRGPRWRAW